MRKILSGLLSTAMVASLCATMASAVDVEPATASTFTIDFSKVALETKGDTVDPFTGTNVLKDHASLTVPTASGGTILITVDKSLITGGMNAEAIAGVFANKYTKFEFTNVKDEAGNLVADTDVDLKQQGSKLVITTKTHKGVKSEIKAGGAPTLTPKSGTPNSGDDDLEFAVTTVGVSSKAGEDAENITVDTEGDLLKNQILKTSDVFVTNRDGTPMILTEDPEGVDKDQNSDDGVQSGKTVYVMVKKGNYNFDDDTYWKMKVTKGDNGKYVKAVKDTSKIFKNDLYNVENGRQEPGTGGTRHRYIKIELNEIYTDDEYKLTFDVRLTPKSKAIDVFGASYNLSDDDELKINDFYFYMKNMVKDADNDWKVGITGLMLNPLENDWNEVTYYDEDGDLAFMKFFADSDVDKFYAKLSTKWEHADYASYFNDQDAFIFNFTGSPKISSTSRCDLQIYNPFIDDDGNETIDPSSAVVYQVIDGDLYDVTDSWKYEEGNNGDMAFTTRTRFLGTYIICEKPVEEAVSDETVPDELTPDTTPEAPEDTTPDNNGGGKAPANTGKYL